MSPDTVSSLFPDRPIRPLPKRRIRERLSPEVADAIKYPPSTHENAPLFYYPPYTLKEEGSPRDGGFTSPVESSRRNDVGRTYTPRRNGAGIAEVEGGDAALRSTLYTRSPLEILTRAARPSTRSDPARHADPQAPPSTTSSIDGYDSFENTNNKKKRKIPSAADTALNGTHGLNNDISTLAISAGIHPAAQDLNGDRSYSYSAAYPGAGSFMANSQGVSGPGRGRLGRSRNARSPLRAISDGPNTWAGRTLKTAAPQWAASSEQEGIGIISSAIANAEKLRPQGQENISLLQQHISTTKAAPSSTQFTFSCESQVPGTVQWPGHSTKHNMGTQTGSGGASGSSVSAAGMPNGHSNSGNNPSAKDRRQARRDLEKEFRLAARQRRRLAAESYFANPPKAEDIWICELCEYERIFGEPPRALIRRYEAKDRKQRQEELDRKRLLEKAKAKSRKARKNAKLPPKAGQAQSQPGSQGDPGGPSNDSGTSHSARSEAEEHEGEGEGEHDSPPNDFTSAINDSGGTTVVEPNLIRNHQEDPR